MTQSIFDKIPAPPTAELLGWRLIAEDPAQGMIESAYHPDKLTLNTRGTVQGGLVAAMLDDTMGRALVSMTAGQEVSSSIDLNVSFVRPVKPGTVISRGRVINRGRSVVFLEAELYDAEGKLLARATSSAIPVQLTPRT
jgi:uncharacterized protein (TIGR00369 family)